MGMAASQARYLALTARQTNTEYQAQQINQQRTALANESANLYKQMMAMEVPVPPSPYDFSKTVYTLDNLDGYSIDGTPTKISGTDNKYNVAIKQTTTVSVSEAVATKASSVYREKLTDNSYAYKVYIAGSSNGVSYSTSADETGRAKNCAYRTNTDGSHTLDCAVDTIYEIDTRTAGLNPLGYKQALAAAPEGQEPKYFYKNANGEFCYLSEEDFKKITSDPFEESLEEKETQDLTNTYVSLYKNRDKNEEHTYNVEAYIHKNDSGRMDEIRIDDNETYPKELQGRTFTLSVTTDDDDDAYQKAYKDYTYKKDLYEKTYSDLNKQTEVIQQEDKILELNLDQLDTEQKAIQTELDDVKKVLEGNIEKTFKIFA